MSKLDSSPTGFLTISGVSPELKRELAAVAKQHNRSVAGETRAALDVWLAVNRREQVKA